MEKRRVAEYFVIAGLPESPRLMEDDEAMGGGGGSEAELKPAAGKVEPITDICVIYPGEGEACPPGYRLLGYTPGGLPADLNHGSIRSPEVFLCYRKGRDKPPLTDLGVLYEGKERVLPGCEVLYTTPYGHCANVNNTTSSKIYLTYRRAANNAASDTLAVTDICVIITSKGESAPHAYCLINRNLNKGTMLGSSVYLCYKKSMAKDCTIVYQPGMLDRYPLTDYDGFPLPSLLPTFALPMGAVLESWPERAEHPKPVFSTFVLTGMDGEKVYGAAVAFYEPYATELLSAQQLSALGLTGKKGMKKTVHVNKAVCIVSCWPFFDAFRKFLYFLCNAGRHPSISLLPVERYIEHFMFEVPFPSPHRPRIMVQLANDSLLLTQPDDSPIPLSGASFSNMLKNLGAENSMNLLTYVLMEHKVLVHSLRPAVLTGVIEAIGSMIFPFRWQCPYIPLCPLGLSYVLAAPTPFIVGIDSQYFDIYEPPSDVTCVDLDTNSVFQPSDKKNVDCKLLPKRPAKVLKATLESVGSELMALARLQTFATSSSPALHIDGSGVDLKLKQKEVSLENAIQEAFLRFMAAILKGYKSYLLPITTAPTLGATSAHTLFDMKGFLKSRDGAYHKFFAHVLNTQLFIRFIEERSFNSKREVSLAFFDECSEKVDENVDTPRLLEADSKSEHTVFVTPPEPAAPGSTEAASQRGVTAVSQSGCFPKLNHALLPLVVAGLTIQDACGSSNSGQRTGNTTQDSYVAKRTKAEIKLAQKGAVDCKSSMSALQWGKCLLSTIYSLWFIQLPTLVHLAKSSHQALRAAATVLRTMQSHRLHAPDEVCYRVLMQLCGQYEQPVLAVKVFCEMRQDGFTPNAITYGVYNQAVLESKWPSTLSTASVMWRRLRHTIDGVARFRQPLLRRQRGTLFASSTPSLVSIISDGADGDSQSRDSMDSEEILSVKRDGPVLAGEHDAADVHLKEEEQLSTDSDMGFTSPSADHTTGSQSLREHSNVPEVGEVLPSLLLASSVSTILQQESGAERVLSAQLTTALDGKLGKARAEPPKPMAVTENDPLGLFLTSGAATAPAVPVNGRLSSAKLVVAPKATAKQARVDMDIRGLFGGVVDVGAGGSVSRTHEGRGSIVGRAASLSPEEWACEGSHLTQLECDGNGGGVKKSDSLDSRSSSYSGTSSLSSTSDREAAPLASWSSEVSTVADSLASSSSTLVKGFANKMLKSWLPKVKSSEAMARSRENLTSATSDDSAAAAAQRRQDEAPRRPSTPTVAVAKASSGQPMKRSGSIGNRLMSVTNVVTNKLYSKYNDLVQTVMEIQAPSTIAVAARGQHERPSATAAGGGGDAASMSAASHEGDERDGNRLGTMEQRSSSIADSMDEYCSLEDRDVTLHNEPRSPAGPMSPSFTEQYIPSSVGGAHANHVPSAESSSHEQPCDASHHVASGSAHAFSDTDATVEVEMCSANECSSCGATLYDEEIMAGWSADDSNLNTTCPFCSMKVVPFLNIYIKDLRSSTQGAGCSVNSWNKICEPEEKAPHVPEATAISEQPATSAEEVVIPVAQTVAVLTSPASLDTVINTGVNDSFAKDKSEQKLSPEAAVAAECCQTVHFLGSPQHTSSCMKPGQAKCSRDDAALAATTSVPYLSPLVLRKELENVLDVEGDRSLSCADFVDKHPIIFWNMVWLFRRLNLVSHLPGFVLSAESTGLSANSHRNGDSGTVSASLDGGDNPLIPPVAPAPTMPLTATKSDSSSVLVRAVWNSGRTLTEARLGPPMHSLWTGTDHWHSHSCPINYSRTVMECVIRGIETNDMHTPILLLLEERLKQQQKPAVSATTSGQLTATATPASASSLAAEGEGKAKFRSIYREMLFLGFVHFGKDFLEHDAFDREYKLAFKKLTRTQRALLQRNDYPPSLAVLWCRKLFGQLEVS